MKPSIALRFLPTNHDQLIPTRAQAVGLYPRTLILPGSSGRSAEASPFQKPKESSSARIVGRQRNFHEVAGADSNKVLLSRTGRVNEDNILSIIQHYAHNCMWHQFQDCRPVQNPLRSYPFAGLPLPSFILRADGSVAIHPVLSDLLGDPLEPRSPLWARKHPRPVFGNRHGVFEVSGVRTIPGYRSPLI